MARHKPNHNSDPFVTTATENCHLLTTAPGKGTELSTLPWQGDPAATHCDCGGGQSRWVCSSLQVPKAMGALELPWELGTERVAQGCPSTPERHSYNLLRAADPTTDLTFQQLPSHPMLE